jgi:hypothetical protein
MVYNGTPSGLNDWLWVPWFPLLTITTLARAVEIGTHMGDLDVGEMFLNFILELKARVRAGVDLTHFLKTYRRTGTHPAQRVANQKRPRRQMYNMG